MESIARSKRARFVREDLAMPTCVIKNRVWNLSYQATTVSIDDANCMRFYLSDDLIACSTIPRTRTQALTLARDILLSTESKREDEIEDILSMQDDMIARSA